MAYVSEKLRKMVYLRDLERCVRCGSSDNKSIQHRKRVGMGGSKSPEVNRVSNLLLMCGLCNHGAEAHLQDEAFGFGWKIKTWHNPAAVPVFLKWCSEWRLNDDVGMIMIMSEAQARQVMAR